MAEIQVRQRPQQQIIEGRVADIPDKDRVDHNIVDQIDTMIDPT